MRRQSGRRVRLWWTLIGAALCSSCATVAPRAPTALCPPLKEYTKAQEAEVGAWVAAVPQGNLLAQWIVDYIGLRNACRAQAKVVKP